jgi:N-acetylmuramic acid 6-phosphate etherase
MTPSADRSKILTETRLPESAGLDAKSAAEIVKVMAEQDAVAAAAAAAISDDVATVAQVVADRLKLGGRLIYLGAGTSGRLGVLDATECPPTFRADPEQIVGLIAGGQAAMFVAQEGAEDSPEGGAADVDAQNVAENDVVLGIAAGGTTPYVHGALRRAKEFGAYTVFLACCPPTPNEAEVDVRLAPLTGPEVLTGSTRLKAGTATKLVLNQITTTAFILLGKCYDNLMVDLKATNAKLWDRGGRIVSMLTDLPRDDALDLLRQADGHVKVAVVMHKLSVDKDAAREKLHAADGRLRRAIER